MNGKTLTTKNIVVATGARPLVLKIQGLELVQPLTSDNVWQLRQLPKNFVILGGGPIGCELAQSFARLGSKVTLIEMSDRIMAARRFRFFGCGNQIVSTRRSKYSNIAQSTSYRNGCTWSSSNL